MGAVYLAQDKHAFGRLCVIKEMLDYYDPHDPQARARARTRFAEEGRTLASLSHPGIPKIYAFFEENGRYFIVMEYILGEDLEQYVTRVDATGRTIPPKPISEEEILRCAIQACSILEYLANQPRPVIHQDVKPANLIRERILGDVRLVDFGTAGNKRPTQPLPGGKASSIYGTMGYAAPEQYQGKAVPRSDVYALSATVYHLLTNDDPRDHPGRFPALATLRPDLRAALEQALRPDPAARSTAQQLREQLEAILTPQRVIGSFAFPGGERIRSVGALPAMCDAHWRSARDYLYNGDFERWLRDLNRLDLVEVARSMRRRYRDRDAGLEAFLRRLDPGLPRPKLAIDPGALDLGRVAREGEITLSLRLHNVSRGYIRARIKPLAPWLGVQPRSVGLLAGKPPTIATVTVHTRSLPWRVQQRGEIEIRAGVGGHISVPVRATVSLWHEIWRNVCRGWQGACPAAWAGFRSGTRWLSRAWKRLRKAARGRLRWLVYADLSLGLVAALGWGTVTGAADPLPYLIVVLAGPLAVAIALVALVAGIVLAGTTVVGGIKGAWQGMRRIHTIQG